MIYSEFETDSPNHQDLNDKYLIGTGTFDGPIWTIYLFAVRPLAIASIAPSDI